MDTVIVPVGDGYGDGYGYSDGDGDGDGYGDGYGSINTKLRLIAAAPKETT